MKSLSGKVAIEDLLDQGLPRAYTPDLYKQKCSAVFEHVYEVYGDKGASLYRSYPGDSSLSAPPL